MEGYKEVLGMGDGPYKQRCPVRVHLPVSRKQQESPVLSSHERYFRPTPFSSLYRRVGYAHPKPPSVRIMSGGQLRIYPNVRDDNLV